MVISSPCPEGKRPIDGTGQFCLAGIVHLSGGLLRHLVGFPEGNPPLQEQPQAGLHGVCACFHDDEVPLGDGLELVRGHEGPLDHLEALAGVILPPGDGAAHHGAAAQSLREHFGGLAVGREAAEDSILRIISIILIILNSTYNR